VVMVLPVAANSGKGAATQFGPVTYVWDGATFTCSGVHVVNNNVSKDNEVCQVTGTGFVTGMYTGNPWGNLPPFGSVEWASDFNGATATSWSIIEADHGGNGTATFDIAAIY
jgi:hypothetical protein